MATTDILDRFPHIELSYETFVHKKVYNPAIVVAIPYGVKHYLWVTFSTDDAKPYTCYSLELNRAKKIVNVTELPHADWYERYAQGTILYGTWVQSTFVVEDIYYYRGIYLRNVNCVNRLRYLYDLFLDIHSYTNIRLAQLFVAHTEAQIHEYKTITGTPVHHLQVRHTENVAPYLNITIDRHGVVQLSDQTATAVSEPAIIRKNIVPDFYRPQYKLPTTFIVRADIQPDIYSLFTAGNEYFGVAYIPSYQKSIFMNSLFRRIRENKCIDYAEDSEDESEFENTAPDKYVDLSKSVFMECVFSPKFKKWIPMKIMPENSTVVPMNELVAFPKTDIKRPSDTYKHNNYGAIRHRESYSAKTPSGVGGLRGQYKRNPSGQTQFAPPRRHSSYGETAQYVCATQRR
jgi:hypothetical protein